MKISLKWIAVIIYSIGILTATPYLPQLINWASSRWQRSSVSGFVLYVEIFLAFLILALGIRLLAIRKKKTALLFLISIGVIFLLSFILYQFLPNPFEFTHFPEYAVLSILVMRALVEKKKNHIKKTKEIKTTIIQNSYFLGGLITGLIGTGDEIYQHFLPKRFFNWYDILLNIIGGILGLLIFWSMKK